MKKLIAIVILSVIAVLGGCQAFEVFQDESDRMATIGMLNTQADDIAAARKEMIAMALLRGEDAEKIAAMEAASIAEEEVKRQRAEEAASTPTNQELFNNVLEAISPVLPVGIPAISTILGSMFFKKRGERKLELTVESVQVAFDKAEEGKVPDMSVAAKFQKDHGVQGDVDAALSAIAKRNAG